MGVNHTYFELSKHVPCVLHCCWNWQIGLSYGFDWNQSIQLYVCSETFNERRIEARGFLITIAHDELFFVRDPKTCITTKIFSFHLQYWRSQAKQQVVAFRVDKILELHLGLVQHGFALHWFLNSTVFDWFQKNSHSTDFSPLY